MEKFFFIEIDKEKIKIRKKKKPTIPIFTKISKYKLWACGAHKISLFDFNSSEQLRLNDFMPVPNIGFFSQTT